MHPLRCLLHALGWSDYTGVKTVSHEYNLGYTEYESTGIDSIYDVTEDQVGSETDEFDATGSVNKLMNSVRQSQQDGLELGEDSWDENKKTGHDGNSTPEWMRDNDLATGHMGPDTGGYRPRDFGPEHNVSFDDDEGMYLRISF